jgi:hypothetical protein
MCFAAPKYYQLGWLSDSHVDISDGGSWAGKMYGISTYSARSGSGDATAVRIDASTDLYVSYNLATGISSGTQLAANQVIVHRKTKGTTSYGLSFIEKTISVGGTETVNGNEITFLSTGNGYANIRINTPPSPTTAPNPNPTPSPTVDDDDNDDDGKCGDDPDFFFENKKGKKSFATGLRKRGCVATKSLAP